MTEPRNDQNNLKTVWIACRATEGCVGNQAWLELTRSNAAVGRITIGSFEAAQGGFFTIYRCQTCRQTFQIIT